MPDEEKKTEKPEIKRDAQPLEQPERPQLRQLQESAPVQRPQRPELRPVTLADDKPGPGQTITGKVNESDKSGSANKSEQQPPKEKEGS
jgi:hypothetical protein